MEEKGQFSPNPVRFRHKLDTNRKPRGVKFQSIKPNHFRPLPTNILYPNSRPHQRADCSQHLPLPSIDTLPTRSPSSLLPSPPLLHFEPPLRPSLFGRVSYIHPAFLVVGVSVHNQFGYRACLNLLVRYQSAYLAEHQTTHSESGFQPLSVKLPCKAQSTDFVHKSLQTLLAIKLGSTS